MFDVKKTKQKKTAVMRLDRQSRPSRQSWSLLFWIKTKSRII